MISIKTSGHIATLRMYEWSSENQELEDFLNDVSEWDSPGVGDPVEEKIFENVSKLIHIQEILEYRPEGLAGDDVILEDDAQL